MVVAVVVGAGGRGGIDTRKSEFWDYMRCYLSIFLYERLTCGKYKCVEKPNLDLMIREIYQTTWRWGSRGQSRSGNNSLGRLSWGGNWHHGNMNFGIACGGSSTF